MGFLYVPITIKFKGTIHILKRSNIDHTIKSMLTIDNWFRR